MSNSQSRKWALVINNPHECGLNHDMITEIVKKFFPDYFCLCDEIAATGTYHTHIFIYSHSPIRFSTLKNRFPTAHIEKAYGAAMENRDYILKSGKWENDSKAETRVEGSFFEYGTLPAEKEENSPKMSRLLENIKEGKRTAEIIDDTPNFAFRIRDIDVIRQTFLSDRFTMENRNLSVSYIFGATGTGKTKGIYQKHNAQDIYRITNYRAGRGVSFDGYFGQSVLVFEEFNSQIPIEDMLNFLDVYPVYLPARYADKIACFTQVYITSNIPLTAQYKDVQIYRPETWKAFLRRIHTVTEYRKSGEIIERSSFL